MKQAKDWAKLKEKFIDDLSAKESRCEKEVDIFQNLSRKADDHNPNEFWLERLKLRESMRAEARSLMENHFGDKFSPRRMQSAESDVRRFIGRVQFAAVYGAKPAERVDADATKKTEA